MELSRTATTLVAKFVLTLVAAWIAFSLVGLNTLAHIVLIAVVGAVVNYFLGDLVILPRYGNTVSSVVDGVVAMIVAYLLDALLPALQTNSSSLVLFGVLVAIGEYVRQRYLFPIKETSS